MKTAATKQRQAFSPNDPDRLTRDELRRLAKAERKLASPDTAIVAAGRREIVDLERRRQDREDDSALTAGLAETSALARARGEEVRAESVRIATPQLDEHGARIVRRGLPLYRQETVARVRIASRGGLQLAFERGDLDGGPIKAEQIYETGKTYRWAFESNSALTTPERNLASVSARAPLRASAGPQDAVFQAGEILRAYRRGQGERPVAVLDLVCGLDMTLRAAAMALKADPRTARKVLIEALTAATDNRPPRRVADDRRLGSN
jgi:hypothetical protein